MPSTLSETSSFDVVTAPIGTDIRNAASVRAALQTVANRTKFLFDASAGPLADIAALKAISAPANNLVRLVDGFGSYVFRSASAVAEVLPRVVAPGAGSGRWHLAGASSFANADASSNFQAFLAAKTRSVWAPVVDLGITAVSQSPGSESIAFQTTNGSKLLVRGTYSAFTAASGSAHFGAVVDVTHYMHDGATLGSAVLRLCGRTHSALPSVKPAFAIWRSRISDATGQKLLSSPASGHVTDAPASVAAYETPHDLTFTPDQNNIIDRSQYLYFANVFDEGGTDKVDGGTMYFGIKLNFTAIADARFP